MKTKRGFSLIEIVVVIAILGAIIGFGAIVDLNSFRGGNFRAEQTTIVSVFERARSHAMANMFQTTYGVCYISPNYIIFQGNTCAVSSTSENIPANTNIASNPGTTFPTIVFNQLTGNTTGATIHITDGMKSADITINNEGRINW